MRIPPGKGKVTLDLGGVAFASPPFGDVAFATLVDAFTELSALGAFAALGVVFEGAILGVERGVLLGVLVGFRTIVCGTNNPVVSVCPNCVAFFTCKPFASAFEVGVQLPANFPILVTTPLSSDDVS